MIRSGADQAEHEQWERDIQHGQADPDRSELDAENDDWFLVADRWAEKAPASDIASAYVDRPSARERREHFDEAKARNALRPRTGSVTPIPSSTRCSCGARETGYPHPGHRYGCPRFAKNPTREAA